MSLPPSYGERLAPEAPRPEFSRPEQPEFSRSGFSPPVPPAAAAGRVERAGRAGRSGRRRADRVGPADRVGQADRVGPADRDRVAGHPGSPPVPPLAPPPGLRPSVALVVTPGAPQVAGALLDLARRGHLTIWYHHLDTGRPRATEDVLFERLPGATGALTDAETELLERVFSHGDCIGVDTLRRLADRWPRRLIDALIERVGVEPELTPVRHRGAGALAILAGLGALLTAILLALGAVAGVVSTPSALTVGVAVVAGLGCVAAVASRRSRTTIRRTLSPGQHLLGYRQRLQELARGQTLHLPADYERVFGPHHPWALALEVVPDWLALPEPETDPWGGRRAYSGRTVWVRRAQRIPVTRHEASVRFVHRVPAPRRPRD